MNAVFYIFFCSSLCNLVCLLHSEHISFQTSHISSAESHSELVGTVLDSADRETEDRASAAGSRIERRRVVPPTQGGSAEWFYP